MQLKSWLRIGLFSSLLLAGCVQPTPTPTTTPALPGGGTAFPGRAPAGTPLPGNYYPAPGATQSGTAYPALATSP